MPTFVGRIELTTEPNPDNYSYAVSDDIGGTRIIRTVVPNMVTVNAALNGVRDFIATKIPPGEVVLNALLTVQTGPPPA